MRDPSELDYLVFRLNKVESDFHIMSNAKILHS